MSGWGICAVNLKIQMVREEGLSSLARGVGPNVFRAVLMNASQLASYVVIKLIIFFP